VVVVADDDDDDAVGAVAATLVVVVEPDADADAVVAVAVVRASTARNTDMATSADALNPPATLRAFAAAWGRRRRRVAFSMHPANGSSLDTPSDLAVNLPGVSGRPRSSRSV
jgi:hypothetical protein